MPEEKPLSTGEIARLLHVTRVTVFGWIRAGKLKAYRLPGGHHRIIRAEFRKFLADHQIPIALETLPPKRILVVDDEPEGVELLQEFLTAKDYEVPTASDGEEALRKVTEKRPHVILLGLAYLERSLWVELQMMTL